MAAPVWRYDPGKGGVFQDDEEDALAMPGATAPTFAAEPAGSSSTPPAPAGVANSAALAGVPSLEPVTVRDSHSSVKTPVVTAADALAQGEAANAADEQADALRTQGELEAKQELDKADTADKKAKTYDDQVEALERATKARDEQIAAYEARAAKLQKEVDATTITDGWANKTTGEKLLVGLSIIANGFSRGLTGNRGPDEVFEAVRADIARDHAEQLRRLEVKRKEIEHLNGPAREAAQKRWEALRDSANAIQVGQLNAAAQTGEALAARTGSPLAVAKMGEKMGKVRAEAAERKQKYLDGVRQEMVRGGGTKEVIPSGAAAAGQDKRIFGDKGETVALAPDVDTAHVLRTKVAAYKQIRALTKRLEKADVNAPLGSAAREQIQRDLDALGTAQAIINNNDGKPSDADTRAGKEEAGTTWAMGTRAKIAKATGREGIDPRTGWAVIGARAREKLEAEFKAKIPGADRLPDAIDRVDYTPPPSPSAGSPPARPAAPAEKKPAPAAKTAPTAETKQLRDPKTGRTFTAYKHKDGQFYEKPEAR